MVARKRAKKRGRSQRPVRERADAPSLGGSLAEFVEHAVAVGLRRIVDLGGGGIAALLPDVSRARRESGGYLRELRELAGLTLEELLLKEAADGQQPLAFTALDPCLLVRTAGTTAGTLKLGQARAFRARGSLRGQGGAIAGCGISAEARALALVIRALRPYAAARKRNFAASHPIRMSSDEASTAAPPYAMPLIMPLVGFRHALTSYWRLCSRSLSISVSAPVMTSHFMAPAAP